MYSFVYVQMTLTSLALKQPFFCILSMQTRLVRPISTKTKNIFLAAIYAFGLLSSAFYYGPLATSRLFPLYTNEMK